MTRSFRRLCAAIVTAGALLTAACGSSYTPEPPSGSGRKAGPLASIYDFAVSLPGLVFPQFPAQGLALEMTLEIDPRPAGSSTFTCTVTITDVKVGGATRPFSTAGTLSCAGITSGRDIRVDSFGPILIGAQTQGTTSVTLSLSGRVAADGRTIDGDALATSSGEMGSFSAVKQRRYLVAATDFGVTGTASLVKVRFNTRFIVERDLETVSGDAVARASGAGVYIINRFFFDNIQSLDPADDFRTALQFSTGNGSNPHDLLAVDDGRLYITRYEPPYNDILIAERGTGRPLGFIEMSDFATNSSATPRADGLVMAEGRVLAGLQNIDASFREYGPGLIAVIDPQTDAVTRTITMAGRNPFGRPAVDDATGTLLYAMAGVFQGTLSRELSGGIEVVDPVSLTTRGLLVDDDDLGGNVSGVAVAPQDAGGRIAYCIVTTLSGQNQVRAFDPDTGVIAPAAIYQSASFLPEIVSDGDGYIIIAEHDISDPRLIVISAATGLIVATPGISLPPFSVAILTRTIETP